MSYISRIELSARPFFLTHSTSVNYLLLSLKYLKSQEWQKAQLCPWALVVLTHEIVNDKELWTWHCSEPPFLRLTTFFLNSAPSHHNWNMSAATPFLSPNHNGVPRKISMLQLSKFRSNLPWKWWLFMQIIADLCSIWVSLPKTVAALDGNG